MNWLTISGWCITGINLCVMVTNLVILRRANRMREQARELIEQIEWINETFTPKDD